LKESTENSKGGDAKLREKKKRKVGRKEETALGAEENPVRETLDFGKKGGGNDCRRGGPKAVNKRGRGLLGI